MSIKTCQYSFLVEYRNIAAMLCRVDNPLKMALPCVYEFGIPEISKFQVETLGLDSKTHFNRELNEFERWNSSELVENFPGNVGDTHVVFFLAILQT